MPHTIRDVVQTGMCVGCGACSVATAGRIPITLSRYGAYEARLSGSADDDIAAGDAVCPFSDSSPNEDVLASNLFGGLSHVDARIGRFIGLYAARVADPDYLADSSSGGMTSWIAAQLLRRGYVDGVIHVAASEDNAPDLFSYRVSRSEADYLSKRKSAYYSSSFAEALRSIRGDGRRYAILAVPCMITAARLLCRNDQVIAQQLTCFLGLVCGHMKSRGFAESLAWQAGVPPQDIGTIDFRVKREGRASTDYDFAVSRRGAVEILSMPTKKALGGNWGHGMFQLNACNYCDDVFAETADVAFGDAWLPRYKSAWMGTNVLVTRDPMIDRMLHEAALDHELMLEPLTADDVAESQAGNFRHRRLGLAVRLQDDIDEGRSVPTKRVSPGREGVPRSRLKLIRLRREISARSHEALYRAKQSGSLDSFVKEMRPLVRRYGLTDSRLLRRALSRIHVMTRMAFSSMARRSRSASRSQ